MRFHCNAYVLIVICASGLAGQLQTTISTGPSVSGPGGSAHFGAPMSFGPAVSGAPYSAEQVSEHVQTLADGTHITQRQELMKFFRDSLGRTRTEMPIMRGMIFDGRANDPNVIVEISDPVAQIKYTFDTINKVAHRQRVASLQERPAGPAVGIAMVRTGVLGGSIAGTAVATATGSVGGYIGQQSAETRPEMSTEKLGTQTIEGVLAEGTRHTTTWPVNSQGNDRPISNVSEIWMSPELHVAILTKSSDPRTGESTQKLIKISRNEPSASLFQPPPDYTVVDEEGDFTVKWGKP